ncbi:hypothetical protein ACIBEJ_00925 [Nonomuraea sp. NPDC050790]|uniref:hypothetical protein n=1 Tax=Nonomuraea sp. NPDC050790 TaxID=3364371 RepID=UPI0037B39452
MSQPQNEPLSSAEWDEAYASLQRRQDTRDAAEYALADHYEKVRRLLLNPDGSYREGARGEVERRLGIGRSSLRYIQRSDPELMRRETAERRIREDAEVARLRTGAS